jgi:hypothetical protein
MDIDVALQYDLKNDGNDVHELEHNYGIVNANYKPKPGYYAYQRIAKYTIGLIHKNMVVNITPGPGRVDPYPMLWDGSKQTSPNDIPVYTFVNPKGQEVVALWSAERANNEFAPRVADIEFKTAKKASKISVMDMLTGLTTEVPFKLTEGGAMLKTFSVPDHVLMFVID